MGPGGASDPPLAAGAGGAHCPEKQLTYREQFLQVVNPNGRMLLICLLGPKPAHVPSECEASLAGIFQPAGKAELLLELPGKWRALSCWCSPVSAGHLLLKPCVSGAVSVRVLCACSACAALRFGKESKIIKGRFISGFFLKGSLAPLKPCESTSPADGPLAGAQLFPT